MSYTNSGLENVIVKPDFDSHGKITVGGVELQVMYEMAGSVNSETGQDAGVINPCVTGTVIALPRRQNFISQHISIGDTILFDENQVRPDQKGHDDVGKWHDYDQNSLKDGPPDNYYIEIDQVIAVVKDGAPMAVGPYLLVDPIEQGMKRTQSGIFLSSQSLKVPQVGKVISVGDYKMYEGPQSGFETLNEGDTVYFDPDGDIQVDFIRKTIYRPRTRNILARVDGDDLIPMSNWVFVKPEMEEVTKSGIILVPSERTRKSGVQRGTVIAVGPGQHGSDMCVSVGDKVLCVPAQGYFTSWRENEYIACRIHEILATI